MKKSSASSSAATATMNLEPDSDESDADEYVDTGRLSPTFSSNQSPRTSDDSQQVSDLDDESMDVDSTEDDQSLYDENNTEGGLDDSYIDSADNWSEDVVVDFDPSTCVAEQALIGALLMKCRSFVKLLNKSSVLKAYANSLKKEFTVTRPLQLDCRSRWNSTHRLLQTMLTYRGLISRIYSEKHEIGLNDKQSKKLLSTELDKEDWSTIASIERVLRPFVTATKLISGTQYPTIGISFFAIVLVREYLEDNSSSASPDDNMVIRLKRLLLFNLDKYFEENEDQWNVFKVRMFLSIV